MGFHGDYETCGLAPDVTSEFAIVGKGLDIDFTANADRSGAHIAGDQGRRALPHHGPASREALATTNPLNMLDPAATVLGFSLADLLAGPGGHDRRRPECRRPADDGDRPRRRAADGSHDVGQGEADDAVPRQEGLDRTADPEGERRERPRGDDHRVHVVGLRAGVPQGDAAAHALVRHPEVHPARGGTRRRSPSPASRRSSAATWNCCRSCRRRSGSALQDRRSTCRQTGSSPAMRCRFPTSPPVRSSCRTSRSAPP